VKGLELKRLTAALVVLAVALVLMTVQPLSSLSSTEVHVQGEVEVEYTYANATYTITFRGPYPGGRVNISLAGAFTSSCQGVVSDSWSIDVPQLVEGEVFEVSVEAMYLVSPDGYGYSLDVPVAPEVSLPVSSCNLTVRFPNDTIDINVEGAPYTLEESTVKVSLNESELLNVSCLSLAFNFNATASPWLYRVKELTRDVFLDGRVTVVDHVTVEGFVVNPYDRLSLVCFKVPPGLVVLEVGDMAGPFKLVDRNPRYGEYRVYQVANETLLQVRPRVSLALGEVTTFYVKYELTEASQLMLEALPPYIGFTELLTVRVHCPPGSSIVEAEPNPCHVSGSTVTYTFVNASQLYNPQISVTYNPPLVPPVASAYAALVAVVVVISLAGWIARRRLLKRKPSVKASEEAKRLASAFEAYMELSKRMWRLHEDHIKGRVKDSTYRKRLREYGKTYMESMRGLLETARRSLAVPQLAKIAQRICEHVTEAMSVEEQLSKLEDMRRSKKITKAEYARKAEEIRKRIERLKDEVKTISSKVSRAIT